MVFYRNYTEVLQVLAVKPILGCTDLRPSVTPAATWEELQIEPLNIYIVVIIILQCII
jgi:hypothetical protein